MGAKLRTGALLAVLAVLLGGLVVTVWRGDTALTQLLMTPLGLIVPLLVWNEKRSLNGGNEEQGEEEGTPGAKPTKRKGGRDELG